MAENSEILELTTEIVSSYVSNSSTSAADLPKIINEVHKTLSGLEKGLIQETLNPAVPIKQSVKPGYIVCLECGKKQKMAKRHLKTAHNLSPEEYLNRWNLPKDYKLTAPDYSAQRSKLAKKIGLGTKRGGRRKK
jgi:predicted transcriptional regulator